jgi:hypothetical protein
VTQLKVFPVPKQSSDNLASKKLVTELFSVIEPTERGLKTTEEEKKRILGLVEELKEFGKDEVRIRRTNQFLRTLSFTLIICP